MPLAVDSLSRETRGIYNNVQSGEDAKLLPKTFASFSLAAVGGWLCCWSDPSAESERKEAAVAVEGGPY